MTADWYTIERLPDRVTAIREQGYGQPIRSYLVEGDERAAVIDTGLGLADFKGLVESLTDLDIIVLQTHAHPDHAGATYRFDQVFVHGADAEKLRSGWKNVELRFNFKYFFENKGRALPEDIDPETFEISGCEIAGLLEDEQVIDLGGRQLDVFHTPGHSPGSVVFVDLEARIMFTGDSVHKGNVAVEDAERYRRSIDKIERLAGLVERVYPSHGEIPMDPAMIGRIRRGFLSAISDRAPAGFIGGLPVFEFEDFGIMLPPRWRRLRDM